ncbi:MAG: phosphatidic acid phosphatase [Eubacteriales bacterium]
MHKTGIIIKNSDCSVVDYRKFRLRKLNTPEFSHLKYLLFWPVFGLLFLTVERLFIRESYFPIHCALDDLIPFCEFFLVPYLFWFVYLVGMHIYTLLFDVESFKGLMKFIMVSYTVAIIVYLVFPNCQELRPITFERDNVFTRFMTHFYAFDTNTNVCPSIHVIGSVAVAVCAWKSKHFSGPVSRTVFVLLALLISVSTVFLKQHSVIDLVAAIPVCILAYVVAYGKKRKPRK